MPLTLLTDNAEHMLGSPPQHTSQSFVSELDQRAAGTHECRVPMQSEQGWGTITSGRSAGTYLHGSKDTRSHLGAYDAVFDETLSDAFS
jgi:hypothetical protein